ncbi:MAG: HlyD family efflux transporter periplasmic adaptor subunit, partial [Clostridiales bacterium]|nr:HlyD family efflux transporter periplasmic adaptor subunit [Clostridiales bacterium]
ILPPGTKLCSVYQPDQTRVDCYILVENIEGVKAGNEVQVKLQLRDEDRVFTGIITRIAQDAVERVSKVGLSEKRIKVEIAVEEEGWNAIGPYWPVEVRFIAERSANCLIVPKTALYEDAAGNWKAWAVRDGRVVSVPVTRGIQTPSQVEIRGEIKPGDSIIRNAKTSKVSDGQKVRVAY